MLLASENLLLSEFKLAEWRELLRYQNDERYLRYLPFDRRSEADVHTLLKTYMDWANEQPRRRFQLAVTLKKDGTLVGSCGVRKELLTDRKAELVIEIAPDFSGRGFGTEATRTMLGFAFGELRLHRVFATCVVSNHPAARVLEKVGMKLEGRLRHNEWIKGQWHDSLIYGILEMDFPDRLRQGGSIWA